MLRTITLTLLLCACCSLAGAVRIIERDGAVMVPLHYVADWLGATVNVNAQTNAIRAVYGGTAVSARIGEKTITVAGRSLTLPTPITAENGITYVPDRFMRDLSGANITRNHGWPQEVVFTHPKTNQTLDLPINIYREFATTPLHLDAYNGLVTLAGPRMARGVKVDIRDSEGNTPLYVAASRGKVDMVRFLLEKGADPQAAGDMGATPLLAAVSAESLNVVNALLARGATCTPDAVVLAAGQGNLAILKALLAKGADLNGVTEDGITPLFYAAQRGRAEVVAYLLEQKANVNITTVPEYEVNNSFSDDRIRVAFLMKERTPLHAAAQADDPRSTGYPTTVKTLLAHGANTAQKNPEGVTPLHCAALSVGNSSPAILNLLLEAQDSNSNERTGSFTLSVYPNVGDPIILTDLTPLHLAVFTVDAAPDKVKILLARKAEINAQANNGMTPLHLAVLGSNADKVIPLLLENGADINAKAHDGTTPLMLATRYQAEAAVQLLKNNGAKD